MTLQMRICQKGGKIIDMLNALYGACMGAVIFKLLEREESFHAGLAVVAFVAGLLILGVGD